MLCLYVLKGLNQGDFDKQVILKQINEQIQFQVAKKPGILEKPRTKEIFIKVCNLEQKSLKNKIRTKLF